MNIEPMLSMNVIKKYLDNIDSIKEKYPNLEGYHKQRMTQEELKKYKENHEIIKRKFRKFNESVGGAGSEISSNECYDAVTSYKLYINPGPEIAKFILPFMQKCNETRMPVRIKIMEPQEIESKCASDVINIYTTNPENIKKIFKILTQVIEENNISLRRKTKEFSISLDQNDTVGLGCDRCLDLGSWSSGMEKALINKIRKFCEENGDLTSSDIIKFKEEYPEKYAEICEELYKILNEECFYQAKKIIGLQEIIKDNPSKSEIGNTRIIEPAILSDGKVQINGLRANIKYKPNRKGYIIYYDDGRAFYTTEIILDAFNRGELLYSREEISKNNSDVQKQQKESGILKVKQLPERAEWKKNSKEEYMLIITEKDGSRRSFPATYAKKHYGVEPPNLQKKQEPIPQIESLPNGAEWVLLKSGEYGLKVPISDNKTATYPATYAKKHYGVEPPNKSKNRIVNINNGMRKIIPSITRRKMEENRIEMNNNYNELETPLKTKKDESIDK